MTQSTALRLDVVDVIPIDPSAGPEHWKVLLLRRASATRCPGSWEVVHGRIEAGERPEDAAHRELHEETGLTAERLYNVTCQPFYLHQRGVVQLAIVFAAFVRSSEPVRIAEEHEWYEWLPLPVATERMSWPRTREAVRMASQMLRSGDAGTLEDVLRVR